MTELAIFDPIPVADERGQPIGTYWGPRDHVARIIECGSLVLLGEPRNPMMEQYGTSTTADFQVHHWFIMKNGTLHAVSTESVEEMRRTPGFRPL